MAPVEGQRCDPTLCEDYPGWSCQLSGTEWVYADARVANAEKGDLLLCPAGPSGVIGTLLGALTPAQHFTHMGIFVSDAALRQCTFIEERLTDPDFMTETLRVKASDLGILPPLPIVHIAEQPAPLDGFDVNVMRFGWPGTVTMPVDDAIYGGLYGDAYPRCRFLDAEHPHGPKMYSVHELTFEPADVPGPTGGTLVLPPLLVKPCPLRRSGLGRRIAWEVADTAASVYGHYRFYGYSDATVAFDASKVGPKRRMPIQGEKDPSQLDEQETLPLVCSSFIWAAVELTAKRMGIKIDLDTDPARNCPPRLLPLYGETEHKDPTTADGLYLYEANERLDAGNALAGLLIKKVHDNIADSITKDSSDGSHTLGLDLRNTITDSILLHHPFAQVVANQFCNTFGSDEPENLTDKWATTVVDGHAVSPDDIYRFWDQTIDSPAAEPRLRGLYGYNEEAIVLYRRPEERPVYTWQRSDGAGDVHGFVLFQGHPVVGITVTLNCNHAITTQDGYVLTGVKPGRYRVTAGMLEPVSRLYVSGYVDVTVTADAMVKVSDIVLAFPSEDYRQILITGHADLVDRQTIGHDHWEHPDLRLRALQIGPGMDVDWDPNRMVWPLPMDYFDPLPGVNRPRPDDKKPSKVRLGDWDYTTRSYGFGGDEMELRAYAELKPGSQDAHVIVEARIIERDGNSIDLEVWTFVDDVVPRDDTKGYTIHLKSAETAPDRAEITLNITNARSQA